jgi:serine/threonine protein kinase/tetratricopeptide (TPR) repeat protein
MTRDGSAPMTPERWRQIQELLGDAIDCAPDGRAALLDARCGADAALRREIESLLAAHDRQGLVDDLAPLLKPAAAWARRSLTEWSGRRVAQYRVEDAVGRGGMAVVHRARDERLGRQVALKFLSPHLSADADAKARFMREARAVAALDHPNVCTIYEIGEAGDGHLFIAMPLYDGETLQARLERGRLAFDAMLPIALQVARGLEHAHEAGVVHGDIKPSNIALLPDGTVRILDFGIARMLDAPFADAQRPLGTAGYMSPEQVAAEPLDARSDVWSLAVVIHEMVAGVRPFPGDDGRAVLEAIRFHAPRLIATSYPDVPAGMDRVLGRALAKNRDERYASVSVFAAEMSALAAEPVRERRVSDAEPEDRNWAERRRAAVLVTTVSDYASLVDQLSPGDAHRLVSRVRDAAVDVMREHGGLVNQAIGDEIVSLFGVPVAHEDDDLRAVRAALELHARVRALPADDRTPARIRVQSGLHVGAVVARRLHEGPRRYDVVGAPASVAARLAALADRDDIWVSAEAQRLVAPYVHTSACAPVVLESHGGPVSPFRVLGETGIATRLEASTPLGLTPYVGRELELSLVHSRAAGTERGGGSVVAVIGEPGAGKSRLLYEVQQRLQDSPRLRMLQARCRPYGDDVPYGVFVQILCAALDLRAPLASMDVAARIRTLDRSLEPFLPLYLHLLSVSSDTHALPRHLRGEHLQAALLDALAAFMSVLAQRESIVVFVEDWHWADSGSRAAFNRVAELAGGLPLVLVASSRIGETEEWPSQTTFIRLPRLDFEASLAIIQSVLGAGQVSQALARRLFERAGGNPFFLEQLCAALLEQERVRVENGDALVEGDEGTLVLPETVQGVIRARLDNLDPHALEIGRVASVIGREFDHALLAEVVPPHVDLRTAVAALESAGLIQQTSVAGPIAYRFTHALTQEVCYDSLTGHQRKTLHGLVGRALAATHTDRQDEPAAALAHHFAHAGDWPAAVRFGRRAAERAIALSQFGDALGILDEVLTWTGRSAAEPADAIADLLLLQERVCETLGLRARQQQIIDSLIAHLARSGSSARLAEVYLRQGDLSTLLKRFDAADRALATALRISDERGDPWLQRSALRSLGLLRWHEGRHAEALDITRRALALDRESDDDSAVAMGLTNLGNILKAMGDYQGARAKLEEALTMPALRDDPKKLVYTNHSLANVFRETGDLERALECLMKNDEIAKVHLLPIQRSFHLTSIAHIHLQQGDIEEAVETYRAAVDLSRRARHADGLVQSLRMLGNVLLGLARYAEALPHLQEAAELFAQLEDRASEAEMRAGVARILEGTAPQDAPAAWMAVQALQRSRGDTRGELDAREGLARAMRARGPDEAIPAFESALALAATIGERAREAAIRNGLGILEWHRGRFAAALVHYESALAIVRGQRARAHEAVILNSLGVCLTKLSRPEEARTVLEEALAISRAIDEPSLEAHALAALGHAARAVQDWNGAAEAFERSRLVRLAVGDRVGAGWMHVRIAELRRSLGDAAGAREAADAASRAAAETGDADLARASAGAAAGVDPHSGEAANAPLHH